MPILQNNQLAIDPEDCYLVAHPIFGPVAIEIDDDVFVPIFTSQEKVKQFLETEAPPEAEAYHIKNLFVVIERFESVGGKIGINPFRHAEDGWTIDVIENYRMVLFPNNMPQA